MPPYEHFQCEQQQQAFKRVNAFMHNLYADIHAMKASVIQYDSSVTVRSRTFQLKINSSFEVHYEYKLKTGNYRSEVERCNSADLAVELFKNLLTQRIQKWKAKHEVNSVPSQPSA